MRNAIKVFKENGIDDNYSAGYGIRLDSGDLAYLSSKCRKMLDDAGLKKCKIFATNSLDEYIIQNLEQQGAQIDSYGVGDAIATSKHNPCFGNVYKLVEIDGVPVLKRSEDKAKLINPGFQVTYRIIKDGKFAADVTCLRGDGLSKKIEAGEDFYIRHEHESAKKTKFKSGEYEFKALQQQVMKDGVVIVEDTSIQSKREYYLANLASLDSTQIRLINPHYYKVDLSDELYNAKMDIINKLIEEIEALDETE
jgi:nicotinate phosphoribosyltransferase